MCVKSRFRGRETVNLKTVRLNYLAAFHRSCSGFFWPKSPGGVRSSGRNHSQLSQSRFFFHWSRLLSDFGTLDVFTLAEPPSHLWRADYFHPGRGRPAPCATLFQRRPPPPPLLRAGAIASKSIGRVLVPVLPFGILSAVLLRPPCQSARHGGARFVAETGLPFPSSRKD